MCILGYDFAILNEAFLIHKPGFKTKSQHTKETDAKKVNAQRKMITKSIIPQLKKIYGDREGCQ